MLADPRDANSLSNRFRRKRDVRLRAVIDAIHASRGSVRILDMGGTLEYWSRVGLDYLRSRNVFVTVMNLQASELDPAFAQTDLFETAVGDACNLSAVADGAYDLAHSNSVIEHVLTWDNMKSFAAETRRVASFYYVQTPNFWFPIDPHFYKFPLYHWFPRPLRARILNTFPIAYVGRIKGVDNAFSVVDDARLLDDRQFRHLFPDAVISYEWLLGMAKSLIAIRGPTAA